MRYSNIRHNARGNIPSIPRRFRWPAAIPTGD
jgi:hypothetical protein